MKSVPIFTNHVRSNPVHGEVYLIQHYVIKFVTDLRQVAVFSLGTPVSSTNKTNRHDIIELLLKMVLNIITLTLSEPDFVIKTILVLTIVYVSISIINYMVKMILQPVVINMNIK
jgi:hypothetical protein